MSSRRTELGTYDHWVYKAYSHDDEILYIGLTTKGMPRFSEHRRKEASWTYQVARLEIEHFPSREEASARERSLIKELDPPYNIVFRARKAPETKWNITFPGDAVERPDAAARFITTALVKRIEAQAVEIAALKDQLELSTSDVPNSL